MNLAHSQLRPQHYCQNCCIALYDHEVICIPLPSEQGCAGATTLFKIECGCGCDVDVYAFQDDVEASA